MGSHRDRPQLSEPSASHHSPLWTAEGQICARDICDKVVFFLGQDMDEQLHPLDFCVMQSLIHALS